MLCFSGFELYSHWMPLLLVPSATVFLAECLGVYSTNIYAGRLRVEVQRLTLLWTIFHEKGTPFLYLLLTNRTLHAF